jgi:CubicO group peptidase (beta-lactamase class C family)
MSEPALRKPAEIHGRVDPRFAPVRDELARNFAERGELGASLCVIAGGRIVVDLWGGFADLERERPWREDSLVMVHSATKGATALCAHVLVARGALDLDAPVARYWPEFVDAGKERLPVRFLLNHRAGLAAIDRPLRPRDGLDWNTMVDALAHQAPNWEPGTRHGYHAITFGWLVGEVVRRISGRSLGRFFRDELAGPLGLDFWIGLPESAESRVARVAPPPAPDPHDPFGAALLDHASLTRRAFMNPSTLFFAGGARFARQLRTAEIPAANGITNARGLAGLYAPFAQGGAPFVDAGTFARMTAVESEGPDAILVHATRFTQGFMKSIEGGPLHRAKLGPNPAAFGHVGAGGSLGMADPTACIAIGYAMNRMGPGLLLNERGQALVDAIYDCL